MDDTFGLAIHPFSLFDCFDSLPPCVLITHIYQAAWTQDLDATDLSTFVVHDAVNVLD